MEEEWHKEWNTNWY